MRPPGPVPVILARGMPCSSARRLARGDARMTVLSPANSSLGAALGATGAGSTFFTSSGTGAGFAASTTGAGAALGGSECADSDFSDRIASMAAGERSSPSSAVIAMIVPTGMDFEPSETCAPVSSAHRRVYAPAEAPATYHDLGQDAFVLRLDVHRRLVRLNLDQHVPSNKRLALLLLPRRNAALGHRGRHCGHREFGERTTGSGGMEGTACAGQSAEGTERTEHIDWGSLSEGPNFHRFGVGADLLHLAALTLVWLTVHPDRDDGPIRGAFVETIFATVTKPPSDPDYTPGGSPSSAFYHR